MSGGDDSIAEALSIFGEARAAVKRAREEEEGGGGTAVCASAAPSSVEPPAGGPSAKKAKVVPLAVEGLDVEASEEERAIFALSAAASRCKAGAYAHAVRLRGLPWHCTAEDVGEFLLGAGAACAEEQAVLVHNSTGDGFFRFTDGDAAARALAKNRQRLRGSRYVEVFASTGQEADDWAKQMAKRRDGGYRGVLRIRGLPFTVTKADVVGFFQKRGVASVHLVTSKDGRPSGEAFVVFRSVRQARNAVITKNKMQLGGRWVDIYETHRGALPPRPPKLVFPPSNAPR